jgi:hypothetical protein
MWGWVALEVGYFAPEVTTSFPLNPSPPSTILIHRLLVWISAPNLRLTFPFASSNLEL